MLLATAAAGAVLALAAPGAYADTWDHEDHGYSKEHDKDSSHDGPRGGIHTGGGALSSLNTEGGWDKEEATKEGQDKESWKGDNGNESWKGEQDKGSWKDGHDKPRGGMHTGGGALASPTVTAGGMAVLAVAGTGLYALRRRKTAGSVA
jgi:hypothetical protein